MFHKNDLNKHEFFSYFINNFSYIYTISSAITLITSKKERKYFIKKLYYIYEE